MVGRIQEHLEAIYGIRCQARATEFLVDEEAAAKLGATGRAPEELLVLEEEGDLELALFLSKDLIARARQMEQHRPEQMVHADLESYCQLAEGVSHFVYLAHVAGQGRTVSLLELEAQAEVDKFASCLMHQWGAQAEAFARELISRLFERVRYREDLTHDERWRYEEANRLAKRYCQRLVPLVKSQRMDRLLSALRYSYRLGAEAKLRFFQSDAI